MFMIIFNEKIWLYQIYIIPLHRKQETNKTLYDYENNVSN